MFIQNTKVQVISYPNKLLKLQSKDVFKLNHKPLHNGLGKNGDKLCVKYQETIAITLEGNEVLIETLNRWDEYTL